jgi:uncharacterized protein YggE
MSLHALAKLPKSLLVLAAAGLAIVGITACDKPPTPTSNSAVPNARQVTVIGSGEVQGTPDTLTVSASTVATASDVTTASNDATKGMQAVIDALVASGIDRRDISTTQVSLQQPYTEPTTPPAPASYQATNSISVKIRRIDTASQQLALIQNAGGNATRINSVNFSIEDDSQLVKDARARAFDDAKNRAEQYAGLSDLTLGKVISISEVPAGSGPLPPTPMPRAMAAEPVPLEPGQQTVGFSVTVVWELV